MFKTIARFLFGGEEQTPEDVKPGEELEEDWLVVSHQGQLYSVTDFKSHILEMYASVVLILQFFSVFVLSK